MAHVTGSVRQSLTARIAAKPRNLVDANDVVQYQLSSKIKTIQGGNEVGREEKTHQFA